MPSSPAASPAAASPVETPAIPRELVVAEEINSLVARLEVLLNEETPDIERAQRASTHGNSLSAKISEINRGEAPLRADVARTLYRDGKILESLLLSVPRTAEVLHSLRYGSNAVGIEAAVRGTGDNYDATMLGVIRLLFDHGVLPPLAHADIIRDPGAYNAEFSTAAGETTNGQEIRLSVTIRNNIAPMRRRCAARSEANRMLTTGRLSTSKSSRSFPHCEKEVGHEGPHLFVINEASFPAAEGPHKRIFGLHEPSTQARFPYISDIYNYILSRSIALRWGQARVNALVPMGTLENPDVCFLQIIPLNIRTVDNLSHVVDREAAAADVVATTIQNTPDYAGLEVTTVVVD